MEFGVTYDPKAAPWNEADDIPWSEDTTRDLITALGHGDARSESRTRSGEAGRALYRVRGAPLFRATAMRSYLQPGRSFRSSSSILARTVASEY